MLPLKVCEVYDKSKIRNLKGGRIRGRRYLIALLNENTIIDVSDAHLQNNFQSQCTNSNYPTGYLAFLIAHSDEADQSVRSDVDQCGAKRRRALLVWNSDRHPSTVFCSFPQLLHSSLFALKPRRGGREAPPRRAGGEARLFSVRFSKIRKRGGKVGNLGLVFHFSTA